MAALVVIVVARYLNARSAFGVLAGLAAWLTYLDLLASFDAGRFSADADVDADGSISAAEWYPSQDVPTALGTLNGLIQNCLIQNYRYNYLGNHSTFSLVPVKVNGRTVPSAPIASQLFNKNDLVVTVNSAQYDGFTPVSPGTAYTGVIPYFLKNHKTIGASSIAQQLIPLMQLAQASGRQQ